MLTVEVDIRVLFNMLKQCKINVLFKMITYYN